MDVNYKVSLYKAKTPARWNVNKDKGNVILYLSNIWDEDISFEYFVERCIYLFLLERICIERAFNKIKIKGGRCNPCCIKKLVWEMYEMY